jgi:hypothetical protein
MKPLPEFLLLLLLVTPVAAQDYIMPKIPTEAEKIEALKLAYRLNGNSMVGPTIDLTDPRVLEAYRAAIASDIPDTIPDSGPGIWPKLEKPKLEKRAEVESNVCTRHNMKKSIRGKSWRCVR